MDPMGYNWQGIIPFSLTGDYPRLATGEAAMAGLPCTTLPRVAVWKPVAFCWTTARRRWGSSWRRSHNIKPLGWAGNGVDEGVVTNIAIEHCNL